MTSRCGSPRASNDSRQVTTNRGHFCGYRSAARHSSYSPVRRLSVPDNVCSSSFLKLNLQNHNHRSELRRRGVKFMQILLLPSPEAEQPG